MAEDLKELVIDRAKWGDGRLLRNIYDGDGEGRRAVGKMCCLGFYCRALGVPDSELGEGMPTAAMPVPEWMLEGQATPHTDIGQLARINDGAYEYKNLSLAEREARIIEIFAKHGTKVTFVGNHPDGVTRKKERVGSKR